MAVTQKDIEEGLREIGLERGDLVLVHSSLSSFGRVEGGAEAVVDAILAVIGPDGTLVVPTFNYAPDPFDPQTTPSIVGSITEVVRLRPDSVRSLHPTHSVAAIGREAEEITRGHENVEAFSVGSPLHKILEKNEKILQIGVNHKSNSMIHVAEELVGVPYVERVTSVTIARPGKRIISRVIRRPGCSRGFDKVEDHLQAKQAVRETRVGESRVRLMAASAVVSAAVEMLSEDPTSLLCEIADCQTCAEARAIVAATQAAEEQNRLAREWEAEAKFTLPETGEEYRLMELDEITTEEGSKNGENHPD